MRCAVVNSITNTVDNIIIADPALDLFPVDSFLIGLSDDSPVSIGWILDGETFIDPFNPVTLPEPE